MKRSPHAPSHLVTLPGSFIVTASTKDKRLLFDTPEKLDLLEGSLLRLLEEFDWQTQAWAVFPNHYHFVALSPDEGSNLPSLISKLHAVTARELNKLNDAVGRKVWFQYWDTRPTFEKSYLARLNYVHNNPVKHRLVMSARDYPWCSAHWFYLRSDRAFYETVSSFPIDLVRVRDDYDVPFIKSFSPPGRAVESGVGPPQSQR